MNKIRIGRELRSLNNIIMRYMENNPQRKKLQEITGTNGWIIGYLYHNREKDVFQRDLEKEFDITRSTASRVVALLIQKGFIQHQAVSGDARLKKLVLTPKAVEVAHDMENGIKAFEEKLTDGFSALELEQLSAFIQRMKNNIRE